MGEMGISEGIFRRWLITKIIFLMEAEVIATIRNFIQELKRIKLLALFLFAFPVVGGMSYFFLKAKTYQSTAKILPPLAGGDAQTGRISSLAALAGVRPPSPDSSLPPDAYQFILESPAFLLNVLYEKIPVGEELMTVFAYIYSQTRVLDLVRDRKDLDETDFRKPVDVPPLSTLNPNEMPLIATNEKEQQAIERLQQAITFNYTLSKPIEISVDAQHPEVAAYILKLLIVNLESCVKQFSKNNADEDLAFVKAEVEKTKQEVYWLQTAVARARDQGINVRKAAVQVELDRLEMDYMDARQRYAALTAQMEAARLKSEKEKQGFIVLESPSVAKKSVAPKLPIYFAASFLLGAALSISAVFFIRFVDDIKQAV